MKHTIQPGAGYKIISSGTSNRSVSIVSGYKISGPIPIAPPNTKENQDSPLQRLEDRLKRSSRYPVVPGLPAKPKLRRQRHVKKHSKEGIPEGTVVVAESPVQTTPEREKACLTPTRLNFHLSPQTPMWARPTQPQRYPSSIFEEYYDDEDTESEEDSPVHTIENIMASKEHETWDGCWNEDMDGHVSHNLSKPKLQRAGTLEVAKLLKNRRLLANDYRNDSLGL